MTWPYLKQYLKFLFVLSCAVSVWVRFFRHRGSLKSVSPFLPAALSFAVAADYCFLFSGNYTAAVAFFCGVQSCYCLVRRASLPRFWLMGAAGTLAFFLGFSLLGVSLDLQSLTAFFYLSCLAVNLVSVIRQKNFWFTVCLLLLLAGDLHVAVYNLHWYLPVGQYHWYQVWWELSTPLIWGFYLPSQLLQAAKMPEICGLRHALKFFPYFFFPFQQIGIQRRPCTQNILKDPVLVFDALSMGHPVGTGITSESHLYAPGISCFHI